MSDRTQEIKNLRAVATACKNYTDKRIDDLEWQLGTYELSVDTNTDTAHIKTLPSGTIQTTVAKVEGVGYKVNQLVQDGNFSDSTGWTSCIYGNSIEVSNNVCRIYGKKNLDTSSVISIQNGHKVLIGYDIKGNEYSTTSYLGFSNSAGSSPNITVTSSYQRNFGIITMADTPTRFYIYCLGSNASNEAYVKVVNIFDLTTDFGSGNEPTSVSDCYTAYLQRGINIYEYTPQQSSIKNNAFTGAKVNGENLIGLEDVEETTRNGMTYSVSNGVIHIKDTPTSNTSLWFRIADTYISPSKTYTFKPFVLSGNASGIGGALRIAVNESIGGQNVSIDNPTSFTGNGYTEKYLLLYVTTSFNSNLYFTPMLVMSNVVPTTYVPYIQPTTISVDLTTIKDSNNVSLFPSGKMMGDSSLADFITPYNQESRWNEKKIKDLEWNYSTSTRVFYATISDIKNTTANLLCSKYTYGPISGTGSDADQLYYCYQNTLYITDYNYTTPEAFINHFTDDDVFQYERATYLTSTTDLTTLTRINAQSNGTITLNNTDNVDMPNTIKSLKEVAK